MNESTAVAKLLTLFASGGTLERIVADLPMFKTQIESVHNKMKTIGRCSAMDITERATRLRELILQKEQAIERWDFDLAAELRAKECAVYESFRLEKSTGETWHTHLHVAIDKQTQEISALFNDSNAA
ncbi:MAG: hypothetical protein WDN00_00480 [Limisphaerales bacterium]